MRAAVVDGLSPGCRLCLHAERGDLEGMRAALAAGAHPDSHMPRSSWQIAKDAEPGRFANAFPLMRAAWLAAMSGREQALALLLQSGADPKLAPLRGDCFELPALALAASMGDAACVRLLLDAGCDPSQASEDGRTPLAGAAGAYSGGVETLAALIAAGAELDAQDAEGETALMAACLTWERLERMRMLLRAGADPLLRDFVGKSALDHAKEGMQDDPSLGELVEELAAWIAAREEGVAIAARLGEAGSEPGGGVRRI